MGKIVVYGSINTDLIIQATKMPKNGETIRGGEFLISHGGKGANQAIAACRLGSKVDLVACLGKDLFGEASYENLTSHGVNTSYIKFTSSCSSSVAVIVQMNQDNRILLGSGSNDLLTSQDLKQYLSQEIEATIFIAQLETPKEEVLEAIKMAKANKLFTILNPTPAERLDDEIYKAIDLLIINQTEAEVLSGIYPRNRNDCRRVYQEFEKKGSKNLIITLGKAGSVVFENKSLYVISGYPVESVDSTGAGDTYIGALAHGLASQMDLRKACKLASAASALAVTKIGAQKGMPTMEEVNQFLEGINENE